MIFEFDDDQRAWREEVRAFLRENVTPGLLRERRVRGYEDRGPEQAAFRERFGARGWFGVGWPKEYGGLGMTPIYQHILTSELEYFRAPRPGIEVTSIAPMIMRHGTEQNRAEFLPPLARGELTTALGYSEPNAGTDLASLRTAAVEDQGEWVINGQKIWNSGAHRSTHQWLCVRTDPDAPKHRGISVIIVPTDTPGIEVRPLIGWHGQRTNETFFTDVRVPKSNLIGEVNKGWQYITGALALERAVINTAGELRRSVDDVIETARMPLPDGRRPIDSPDIRRKIAQIDADVEVAVLMGLEASCLLADGQIPTVSVTAGKVFASELRQRIADVGTQMLGLYGVLVDGDRHAPLDGEFERLYRAAPLLRFGGGANEVLRDAIAQQGYAMPRYR
jgi:3-oxocholest-4-en-26-oyl-CoA dehydrogenase alpha subunit